MIFSIIGSYVMQYSFISAIGCNSIRFRPSIQPVFCLISMIAPFLCFNSAQAQIIGQDITSITTDTVSFPVSQGKKVYGYSLFAPDVTCTPKTLLNVANSCFPTNTGTNGGIDLAAPNLGAVFLESE